MIQIILLILAVLGIIFLFNVVGNILNLIIMVLVWMFIGWAASRLLGGDGSGALGNILIGLVGGIVGRLLFSVLGISLGAGIIGQLIVGVVGAVIFIFIWRAISKNQNFGM